MRISRASVERPVFVTMVMLIVVIIGGVSFSRLPIDLMPDITYPTLTVSTYYESASPEEMEELITRPIEEAMSAVPGVEEVTSISTEGRSDVRISFDWGRNLDSAANDIRDRLDRVIPRLPEDAERPTLRKFDMASFPIILLGAYSDLDPIQMRHLIEKRVKYRIERVPGVAALGIHGGLTREIHVNLYAEKVKALALPLDLILARIRAENVNVPAGLLERGRKEVMVRTPGEYSNLDELRNTVITVRDGAAIRLRDIAEVRDTHAKVRHVVLINGKPGMRLSVNKQSGTNTVQVARGVYREVARINRDIPQIHLTSMLDTAKYTERAVLNVGKLALYGGALAILVLFLFLRSVRSTVVIATAIPVSIIATFAPVYFAGSTLNLLTLGGLALGIGMLVDNAIVVLENIYRLHERGMPPREAAVQGSEEVTAAIIASTLTTLAVFLPLIFLRGRAGVMFKEFALVVGFALLCSLGVAITFVPMLAARLLRGTEPNRESARAGHGLRGSIERWFGGLEETYRGLLAFALDHRLLVVFGAATLLAGSLLLIPLVGTELMPSTDEGQVRVYADMEVGTRVEVVGELFDRIHRIVVEKVPEMESSVGFIGSTSWRAFGSHTGQLRISLKPQAERERSSEQIAADLRRDLGEMPGVKLRTRAGGLFLLRMIAGRGGERIQIEIRGHDLETATAIAKRVQGVAETVSGVTDARISREIGNPEEIILVDRQKAADMKLSVENIATALQTALAGTRAGNFREGGDEYRILVKLREAERLDLREVLDLTVTNGAGEPVVLRNVVRVRPRRGPERVERKDQQRIVVVSVNISGRDMGSVIADIRAGLRGVPVPREFSIVFGGDYEEQQKAFRELLLSFVLALVLVYMVMACQYESLRDPFVVMFSVPLAAIGVVLLLLLTETTFNIQSLIGCIMLGGIVVNNSILLVDHINLLRRRDGLPLREAIEEAGLRRLRPILMTATTTILGLMPLALGIGEGSEAQAPMARAVIGGLLSSTLISLLLVPSIYSLFARTR